MLIRAVFRTVLFTVPHIIDCGTNTKYQGRGERMSVFSVSIEHERRFVVLHRTGCDYILDLNDANDLYIQLGTALRILEDWKKEDEGRKVKQ